ncbi:MAG: PQQ-dependent sugar dehydrogenase [Pseudomonadota bacterium]
MSPLPPAPLPPSPDPTQGDRASRRDVLSHAARWSLLAASWGTLGAACGGGGGDAGSPPSPPPPPPPGARLTELNDDLVSPWGLAFLPDGRMLVTEKAGRLRRLSADGRTVEAEISGVPSVSFSGQGGLLDVVIDPNFTTTPWVYLSYSEPGAGSEAGLAGTAIARGRLVGNALQGVQVIYRQVPKVSGSGHYGSRMVFAPDGNLFVTLGERQKESPAQDLATTLGKVIRIRADGTVPPGNPDLGAGARPEIWSYGHRNPQGVALHPVTGDLWLTEHGPQGGDELNRVQRGGNHGWPRVSYGCPYGSPVGNGCRIGGGTHAPEYVEPVSYWVPTSTAPSSLLIYDGSGFPEWNGNVFIGALAGMTLWRIVLDGSREVLRDQPLGGTLDRRTRCVRQGPDGWIYLLTDDGELLRIDR